MTSAVPVLGFGPAELRTAYREGRCSPGEVIDEVYRRIAERGEDSVWISLVPYDVARAAAERLDPTQLSDLPLFGVPFSVKDNIDVAGLETTAGCPEFAHEPEHSAAVVVRLQKAGAILVGKTNLDQFATGLSGARSPYGIPSSVHAPALISGGSSSGAAVSVAAGLVGFAIGTDTAGSGRVPAALNGIVGVKPSIGLVSTTGMVPACRSLDCASVFSSSVADGVTVLGVLAGFDAADPQSRRLPAPGMSAVPLAGLRLGVPATVETWGTRGEEQAWIAFCSELRVAGADLVPVDLAAFREAGRLLYDGPWVAERLSGLASFVRTHPEALLEVTRTILSGGERPTGVETFAAADRLRALKRQAETVLTSVDVLLTPTVTETFTIAEMVEDPIALNSRLGRYTTFTNLLDLCAVAVPVGGRADAPFGVSVHAGAGRDAFVAGVAGAIERLRTGGVVPEPWPDERLRLAVVGAHLRGMPLHDDLLACGAEFEAATATAPGYRLFALAGGPPERPGLCRDSGGEFGAGASIEVEVYRIPRVRLGDFMTGIPAPLGIGRVALAGGDVVHGFICEPAGLFGAVDITAYGGWRAYLGRVPPDGNGDV